MSKPEATEAEQEGLVDTEGLMDTCHAAKYLGLSKHTLLEWRKTRRVEVPYVKMGFAVRYRRADLDAWIAKNTVGTGS